jgi:hypothetical protein
VLFDLSKNYPILEDGSTILPIRDLIDTISLWERSHVRTVFNMMSKIKDGALVPLLDEVRVIVQPE